MRLIAAFFQRLIRRISAFLHSLRFRLTLWFIAILSVVIAVFSSFIYYYEARELHTAAFEQLALQARQLVTYYRIVGLQISTDGKLIVPTLANDSPFLQKDEILMVVDAHGNVLYTTGPIDAAEAAKLATYSLQHGLEAGPFAYAMAQTTSATSIFRQDYYFAMSPLPVNEANSVILILGSSTDPGGLLERLLLTLLLAGAATVGVAWLGGYWLANRAMRPVQTISRTAREIGETDLNRRLNLHAQDELGELADTFDQMLARLQAAFERQRQFTADASHELRTPLTIINLETDRALATRRPPEEYERALKTIRSENEYMTGLVNDLMTLARMDAGQAALRMETVDLSEVALDVMERLSPLAKRKGVAFTCGELPELLVWGDRQYLGQMMTNLMENAIKYTDGANKAVAVETGRELGSREPSAWVRVSDNGPGIAAEHLPHLFDRFYRADKARSRQAEADGAGDEKPSGSGLGLSIVQWIVQSHGGQVKVQSEVGKGSVFEVSLPLTEP